jgi:coenzyme F420-0:L-glutamate ligase/coenzyme F420-1:gamma-L-glutamate ligase
VALLPLDPDASARALSERLGVPVVITDTFGRPWRRGLVDVAVGCSGIPALMDLRGGSDHTGRKLEATVMALADQVAAAAGLVMGKDAMVPVAVVRGVEWSQPPSAASELVRPPEEDMFRESVLQALVSRRTIRTFGAGTVPREAVAEAVEAACAAPAPHHTRPWTFVVLDTAPSRRKLLDAMADAWRSDMEADGTGPEVIARRLQRSEALLGSAPTLVVPLFSESLGQDYQDAPRREAEREMFVLSAGAAVQNLLLALHARGLASAWVSSGIFCREQVRTVLGLDTTWSPAGTIAVGPMPVGAPPPRPGLDLLHHLRFDRPTLD